MSGLYEFPESLRRSAETALLEGERILWSGRPDSVRSMLSTWPVVAFGLPWTAISLCFMAAPIATMSGVANVKGAEGWVGLGVFLFAIPFVLIGLALVTAPYWTYREAQGCIFLVTDRRVVKVVEGRSRATKWLAGRSLRGAETAAQSNGSGTVKALGPIGRDSDGDQKTDEIVMIGVKDPGG
ncbi:MAG: hypothetical protein K2Q06_07350, partial [Parvularculaceae bacterium]|nr:hypothetical protein [Parvularculaceae bacterium]